MGRKSPQEEFRADHDNKDNSTLNQYPSMYREEKHNKKRDPFRVGWRRQDSKINRVNTKLFYYLGSNL